MLKIDLIKNKINLIQQDLERLVIFGKQSFDDLAKDYYKFAAVKNILRVCHRMPDLA